MRVENRESFRTIDCMAKRKPPDKVALVTGAGQRRIGWHVAAALAKRGYALAIHYRSSAAEAIASVAGFYADGVPAVAVQADLTDETAVKTLIERTRQEFGRLDVLVNCAADWKPNKLEEVTAADVRHYLETNTLSTFLCSQHAGLAMVQQPEGGNIVTIGDWATHRPYLDYAAYFPSKGAIPTLTRTFAVELGTRNPAVRVNCILPGPVMLPPDLPDAERHGLSDQRDAGQARGPAGEYRAGGAVFPRQRLRDRRVSARGWWQKCIWLVIATNHCRSLTYWIASSK